jgi:hypothetical protein
MAGLLWFTTVSARYVSCPTLCKDLSTMPLHTEARIHALCKKAVSAHDEAEVERIVSELRTALNEHIRYARVSLQAQAKLFLVRSKKDRANEDGPDEHGDVDRSA